MLQVFLTSKLPPSRMMHLQQSDVKCAHLEKQKNYSSRNHKHLDASTCTSRQTGNTHTVSLNSLSPAQCDTSSLRSVASSPSTELCMQREKQPRCVHFSIFLHKTAAPRHSYVATLSSTEYYIVLSKSTEKGTMLLERCIPTHNRNILSHHHSSHNNH